MFRFLSCNYNKNGTELKIVTMEQMLMHCKYELPKNGEKGKYGSIFVYDKEEMGYSNDSLSTGVIVIDYDWISKETADSIFNGFNDLCYYMPSLYAIQYSSSYFINPKKNGLHIYIKTGILNKYEFEFQATLAIHYLAALINKFLGIDLRKENENEKVIDTHNCKMSQRVNLFYSPFWYNRYAVEFNPSSISTQNIEVLMKVYGFELDFEKEKNIKPITPIYGGYNNRVKGEKLKIDRNFKIGKLSGNDIRFRISIIADILFGDKAKEFCDNNFYFEDNKSIYSKYNNKNKYCDELVKHWLEENGYIVKKNNREVNTYLSEFHEDILKEINGVNKALVVAPTGCGKTHYINNLLAIEKNAVVITPFNITNHLYNNCLMVNSLYGGDIPNNKPIVIGISTNDGLGVSLKNIGIVLNTKNMYFIPFRQDDYIVKPFEPLELIARVNSNLRRYYVMKNSESDSEKNQTIRQGRLTLNLTDVRLQKDEEDNLWVMLHSGSRNLGKQVCDYYDEKARVLNRRWHSVVSEELMLSFLPVHSDEFKQYWAEMEYCVDFALANRHLMMERIKEVIVDVFPGAVFEPTINIAHN